MSNVRVSSSVNLSHDFLHATIANTVMLAVWRHIFAKQVCRYHVVRGQEA